MMSWSHLHGFGGNLASLTPDEIEDFLTDLNEENIPPDREGPPSPLNRKNVDRALLTISYLRDFEQSKNVAFRQFNKAWPPIASAAWPRLWAWTQYFHENCMLHHRYSPIVEDKAISAIAWVYFAYCTPETDDVLVHTPGCVQLLTKLWLKEKELEKVKHYLGRVLYDHPFGTYALAWLLRGMQGVDKYRKKVATSMLQGAEGSEETITSYVVDNLRECLAQSDKDFIRIGGLMKIALGLCFTQYGFAGGLLQKGACSLVAQGWYLASTNLQLPEHVVLEMIMQGYTFIMFTQAEKEAPTYMVQALNAGLLKAMLLSAAFASRRLEHLVVAQGTYILKQLGKYISYRSVLRIINKPFREITREGMDTQECVGPLWDDWVRFKKEAQARLTALEYYGKRGLRRLVTSCEFSGCSGEKMKRGGKILQCGGCTVVHYCSKDCQRQAWPTHRVFCRVARCEIKAAREILKTDVHVIGGDYSFFHFLVDYDFATRQDEIITLLQQARIPSITALSTYIVGFDYSAVPMKICVSKDLPFIRRTRFDLGPESTLKIIGEPIQTDEERMEEAAKSGGTKIIVQARCPSVNHFYDDTPLWVVILTDKVVEDMTKFCRLLHGKKPEGISSAKSSVTRASK